MKIRYALALAALLPILAAPGDDGTQHHRGASRTGCSSGHRTSSGRGSEGTARLPPRRPRPKPPRRGAGPDHRRADRPGPGGRRRLPGDPERPAVPAGCRQDQVTEIFGYVCPACAAFQPLVGRGRPACPAT